MFIFLFNCVTYAANALDNYALSSAEVILMNCDWNFERVESIWAEMSVREFDLD